jgi:hypothetical protein
VRRGSREVERKGRRGMRLGKVRKSIELVKDVTVSTHQYLVTELRGPHFTTLVIPSF